MKCRGSGNGELLETALKGTGCVNVERIAPSEDKGFEAIGEAAGKFNFANRNVFSVAVRDDKKARLLMESGLRVRRSTHFSTKKLPMTSASMPEEKKVRMASVGVCTMASPRRL